MWVAWLYPSSSYFPTPLSLYNYAILLYAGPLNVEMICFFGFFFFLRNIFTGFLWLSKHFIKTRRLNYENTVWISGQKRWNLTDLLTISLFGEGRLISSFFISKLHWWPHLLYEWPAILQASCFWEPYFEDAAGVTAEERNTINMDYPGKEVGSRC